MFRGEIGAIKGKIWADICVHHFIRGKLFLFLLPENLFLTDTWLFKSMEDTGVME